MSFRNDDNFDSESYVKVNTRLEEFWQKNPKGRVETGYQLVDGVLIMEARLYREGEERPAATGHSFLDSLSGEKVGEYTETVAVGRALALMGFRIEKSLASGEEMSRWKQRQDGREAERTAPAPAMQGRIRPSAPKLEPKVETKTEPAKVVDLQVAKDQPKEISDTPEVPKTLKAARIFKPRPKDATTGGSING